MMKKTNLFCRSFILRALITALVLVMLSVTALAVDVSTWDDIVDAVTNGGANVEIRLLDNITAGGVVDVKNTLTVDFNGYTLTNAPGCESAFYRYMAASLYYKIGTEADLQMSLKDPSVSTIQLAKDIQINTNNLTIDDLSKVDLNGYTIAPSSSWMNMTIRVDTEEELRKALETGATSIVLDANINLTSELVTGNAGKINLNGHSISGESIVAEVDTYQELKDAMNSDLVGEVRMTADISVNESFTITDLDKLNLNGHALSRSADWQSITADVTTEAELRKALDMGGVTSVSMQNDITLSSELVTDNAAAIKTNGHALTGADVIATVDTWNEFKGAYSSDVVDTVRLTGDVNNNGEWYTLGSGLSEVELNGNQINGSNLTINVYNEDDLAKALEQPALNSAALQGMVTVSSEIEADFSVANKISANNGSLSLTGSGKVIATVSTEQELKDALNKNSITHAKLENDIEMSGNLSVDNTDAIILNGYKLIFAEGNGIAQNVGTEEDFLDALKNPDVSKIMLTDDITISADLLIENMPEIIKNNHDILLGSGVNVTVNVDKWSELKAAVDLNLPGIAITLTGPITAPNSNGTLNVKADTNINLNGKELTTGESTLFNVTDGAELTVRDTAMAWRWPQQDNDTTSVYKEPFFGTDMWGHKTFNYYVTTSQVTNATVGANTYQNSATRETRQLYSVSGAGLVDASKSNSPIFSVSSGSKLNVTGGVYYGSNNRAISSNGTVNLSGDTVFAGNKAATGGAVAVNGGTLTIAARRTGNGPWDQGETHGVVMTGNTSTGTGRDGGGALYVGGGAEVVMNGGYITNNHAVSKSYETSGGGVAVRGKMTMNGGYITANQASAGGGLSTWYWEGGEFYMNGGFVAGNVATLHEGGGGVINFKGYGEITGGYITNNKTLTEQHWGGGGVFCSDFGVLRMKSVLIVDNEAGGFGGGLAGCSTGRIDSHDTSNNYAHALALFDNAAAGTNMSGGESTKDIDRVYAKNDEIFTRDNGAHYQDYFCALSSRICGGMLNGGTANWSGTIDGEPVFEGTVKQSDMIIGQSIVGLTAHPTKRDKENAVARATRNGVVISGNYSNTHGGGVLCNGYLVIGTQDEMIVGDRMDLRGTKTHEGIEYDEKDPFTFIVVEDKNKNDVVDRSEMIVLTGEAKESGEILFNTRLSYDEPGVYHYLINENQGDRPGVKYDETVYKLVVTVESTTSKVTNIDGRYPSQAEDIEITFSKITNVKVYKKEAGASSFSFEKEEDANSDDRGAYHLGYGLDFVNEKEDSDLGGLKVSKKVVSALANDLKREFTFTVELDDDTISGKYGDVEFENGVATFTLTNEGTAAISGLPAGVGYVVSETPVDGFTTSIEGSVEANIVKNAQPTIAFTNTKNTGDLSVTKTLSDNKATGDEEFTIVVTLDDNGITGTYGDMEFAAGAATITLKADETKTATGLPVGVGYTVEEKNAEGYTIAYTGETGTISKEKAKAVVANAKEYAEGSLTLKKSVEGNVSANKTYSFTLTLSDDSISGTYGDAAFWNGVASVALAAGDTLSVTDLPAGVVVSIAEAELGAGWSTQVKVGEEAPVVSIDAEVTIVKDGTQTVEFINSYETGDLTVSKKISANPVNPDAQFTFTVTLSDTTITGEYGEMTFANGVATFVLKDGETKTATGLPQGVTYTVAEEPAKGYVSSSEGETGVIGSNPASAQFINTKNEGSLTLTKKVTGAGADESLEFEFTITLFNSNKGITADYNAVLTDGANQIPAIVKFVNGSATVKLRHNQSLTINGIPTGLQYTVTEKAAEGYVSSLESANGQTAGNAGAITTEPAAVTFINRRVSGGLTLTKKVVGTVVDRAADNEFTFRIKLDDETIEGEFAAESSVAGRAETKVTFVKGDAEVKLAPGESMTIKGLPTGVGYTVSEILDEEGQKKYNVTYTGETGTISETVPSVSEITNTRKFGGLKVNKVVASNPVDTATKFTFKVTISEPINGMFGEMNFVDGVAEFTLSHGESIEAEHLPVGATYKVEETDAKGYVSTSEGVLEAEIAENVTPEITFTNTMEAGAIELKKNVDTANAPEQTFTFALELSDKTISTTYSGVAFTNGEATVTLKAGESLKIEGLPVGLDVKITEAAAGAGWTTKVKAGAADAAAAMEATVTVVKNETQVVEFINSYAAQGEVTLGGMKVLEGRELEAGQFSFELKNEAGEVIETVQNAADGSIAFSAIKYALGDAGKTFKYTVSEVKGTLAGVTYDETVYTVEVKVEDNGDGTLTATASENANALNFVNKALGKLRLSKSVTGEGADKTLSFDFTISLKDKDGQPVTATYFGNAFIGGQNVTAKVNVTDGSVVIALKDGEWIEISGIPVGYTYEVTESPVENFTSSATGASGMITTGGVEAAFINRYEMKRGGLMVTKSVVSPNAADLERKFTFTVELGDETINGTYGQMSFENGVAAFELGDGESIYASNLPEGLAYTVEEEEIEGFTPTVMSGETSGVIVANVEPRIAFVNTREIEYGSLTVKKTITGDAADKTKKFTFRVTLDQQLTGEYGEMTFENGVATFKLGHNETITATDLPEGVGYTVTELDSADYVVTCTYETGTIQAKKTVTATFINNREKGTVPKTGDDSHLGLYAVMLAMSSAAMLYMALRRRRA